MGKLWRDQALTTWTEWTISVSSKARKKVLSDVSQYDRRRMTFEMFSLEKLKKEKESKSNSNQALNQIL